MEISTKRLVLLAECLAVAAAILLLWPAPARASDWLVSRAKSYVGFTAAQAGMKRTTLWCSEFVCKVTGRDCVDDRARSWLARPRTAPRPGVIAVMSRGRDARSGHVAIVLAVDDATVLAVSGNQRGRVGVGRYPRSRVIAFVEP
jgi:uncharacterized protein (TIGR02594 family)